MVEGLDVRSISLCRSCDHSQQFTVFSTGSRPRDLGFLRDAFWKESEEGAVVAFVGNMIIGCHIIELLINDGQILLSRRFTSNGTIEEIKDYYSTQ